MGALTVNRTSLSNGSVEVDVALVDITPEMAEVWLQSNTRNRTTKKDSISSLSEALLAGDWIFNGQTIVFDSNGVLSDGQNRLHAIIKAGISACSLVVWGVEPLKAQDTQDSGVKRSVADQLTLHGFNHAKDLASILGPLSTIRELREWPIAKNARLTVPLALRMLEDFPDCESVVREAQATYRAAKLTTSVSGVLIVLFREIDQADAETFFELLRTGAGLEADSPIIKLRERLWADAASAPGSPKLAPRNKAALTIKAWNAWRAGETPKLLRWRSGGSTAEPFPAWDLVVPQ